MSLSGWLTRLQMEREKAERALRLHQQRGLDTTMLDITIEKLDESIKEVMQEKQGNMPRAKRAKANESEDAVASDEGKDGDSSSNNKTNSGVENGSKTEAK
ncbi:unnamed protein product [Vitrella brassicaformis CCMP3155]|uniref:CWF21 domain-containing protein n=1 Tax=Vitrella brassicaformis (strain CCMP3155) TaxID=1169540 RepID=A0A0G4EGS5_VITBC|nr:unnamed protein product [Vitrella brassicaformis CCMP3155]|eukprot:CEL94678.1 unnamed protein product [Vitrella brassicaformis CCMP3155]